MNFVLIFLFCGTAFAHTILRDGNRIVGGTVAQPGQFPYQISHRVDGQHNCGGSIVDQVTILTAAHCTYPFGKDRMKIVVGTNRLNGNGKSYAVSKKVEHKNYNPQTQLNDIAVLKLNTAIVYTDYIKPISIDPNVITAAVPIVASGWGLSSYPGNIPNDLLYFEGNVFNWEECKYKFAGLKYAFEKSHICAYAKRGVGICRGDSGGPLVSNGNQIGVVSYGFVCAVGIPDVYTRVASYVDWIKNNMG